MGIDKLTASLLFAHSFKLVDKEGNEYEILQPERDAFLLKILYGEHEGESEYADYNQIGKDFFVLCRPLTDLIKEVNGVVPIVELAKIEYPNLTNPTFEVSDNLRAVDIYDEDAELWLCFNSKNQFVRMIGATYEQELLFNKLYSLHFKPSSLPDECCRFIEG